MRLPDGTLDEVWFGHSGPYRVCDMELSHLNNVVRSLKRMIRDPDLKDRHEWAAAWRKRFCDELANRDTSG